MNNKLGDYVIDTRISEGLERTTPISGHFQLSNVAVQCVHLEDWPVFPDLLVGDDRQTFVGLAFSVNSERRNGVRQWLRSWHPKRYDVIEPNDELYEQLVGGLGTNLPYVVVWARDKCSASPIVAQLGPEAFSWLVQMDNSTPIGVALHDFSETLDEFGLRM